MSQLFLGRAGALARVGPLVPLSHHPINKSIGLYKYIPRL